ncbi:MAG: S1 RNA-binding domain-containing protein [Chloroflexi bacterium]|nr:S1 RNA-binding domain-containing protein [Chloroflexota bacterium]MDA1228657.1 S1 RNA-binding domain-containing protein [Chloroflexota bacterium]
MTLNASDDEFDSSEDPEGMEQLLESMEPLKPLRRGDVIEGVVMRVDGEGIIVHIGHKAEGVVPAREMRTLSADEVEAINVGDEIVTYVVRPESADDAAILSVDRAVGETGWHDLEKSMEANETVEGQVIGFNRGGAIVEVQKIQGFVPMSQLVSVSREVFKAMQAEESPEPEALDEQEAVEPSDEAPAQDNVPAVDVAAVEIGKELQLKILEINRGRNRAIFSERQAVQEWRDEQKARLVQELQEGETRTGKVTGISSFGAFVDLGGADGLIHISEMSWGPVNSPEDVVQVGQDVDVFVLRVDTENRKIALSLRRLQPEPWETINDRYAVGDLVDATITKLTNFGAFARVEGNIEGLIHISELASRMIQHPKEVVGEGDEVKLKILRIEPERRRLGLSLKAAEEELL